LGDVPDDKPSPDPNEAFRRFAEQIAGLQETIRRAFNTEAVKSVTDQVLAAQT
jgi:hypothetical protein